MHPGSNSQSTVKISKNYISSYIAQTKMHGEETTKNLNPTINILLKVYRLILDCIQILYAMHATLQWHS